MTNGQHSFTIFNYLDDGINWNKGDDSTIPAYVGFNFGGDVQKTYNLPDSGKENITEIDTASNMNTSGQFVFQVTVLQQVGCDDSVGMQIIVL